MPHINIEERKAYKKTYYLNNKNNIKEYQSKYYLNNKKKFKEINRLYRLNNKEFIKKYILKNKEIIKQSRKLYYLKNAEKLRQYTANYNLNNKDKIKRYSIENAEKLKKYRIEYVLNNKDKVRKTKRLSRLKNPSLLIYHCAKRRALQLNATPKFANTKKIREIYKNCPKGYVVDHIVPLQGKIVCGLHVEWNLQYLTPSENSSKSNRFVW
jgi:hypothetical protein